MRVIGTAGHVDHGKSTLVERLTGIDPARLAEEKARKLTIDLGFAWLELTDAEIVGIVDVPGHRDFIENMLAGVGSIDATLLVIAADEGVMPQTREHLAILDLLGIHNGVVALTKVDLVDDEDWLDLVEQDILDTLEGTALADANIVRVSAFTGEGIPELLEQLGMLLADLPPQRDYNQPRLSVDRVFTISGFGTVVTGTLVGGALRVGDEIELQPGELRGRIRGLQTYQQAVEIAYPGSRVAVNISGIEKRAIIRGHMLSYPGHIKPTLLADVYFRHLPDAGRALKHNAEVKVFAGAAETTAHVRLLGDETLPPGAEGWLQLRLDNPLPLARSDRYILRYPSPPETIGGGIIVNPHPRRRWKRFQPRIIKQLETLFQGTPSERVTQAAEQDEPITRNALQRSVSYSDAELDSAIAGALENGSLVELPDGSYLAATRYHALKRAMADILQQYHRDEPLRIGMPREELRSRLNLKSTTMNTLLAQHPDIEAQDNALRLKGHQVQFDEQQQAAIRKLMGQMEAEPYTPPSYSEAGQLAGEKVLRALIELEEIVQVQPDVILSRRAYEEMVAVTLSIIDEQGSIDAKTLRDHFNTSRKYAIGLLEHLDSAGITRRIGDKRIRGRS